MNAQLPLYVDHAATAPLRREVLEAMWPWLTQHFANPSSPYGPAREARTALEHARQRVADVLGANASTIIFTSGGSEADNLAIKGLTLAQQLPPEKRRVLISPLEHPAIEGACDYLERYHGFQIERLKVNAQGHIDLADLAQQLKRPAALVSIIWAHNEIGTLQWLQAISAVVKRHKVLLHVDAVQAMGWLTVDVHRLQLDALTLSGHKLGAGRGIGALYVRNGVALEPLIHGGNQEHGRRGGTEALPNAIGLARALELAQQEAAIHGTRLTAMRDRLIARVLKGCPGARLTGAAQERLPHHASFVFPGTHGEAVLVALEARGIYCSSGSACKAGEDAPSPTLLALGISPAEAQTAVRFSLPSSLDEAALDTLTHAIVSAVDEVKALTATATP